MPALLFSVTLFALQTYLVREVDVFHAALVGGGIAIMVAAIVLRPRARRSARAWSC